MIFRLRSEAMFKKFIRIITFVDLPIRKKFLLFSLSVLFWFLVMFAISIKSNIIIENDTNTIVKHIVPVDRTIQKITRKLQGLKINASEIAHASDPLDLEKKIAISKLRIADIQAFATALTTGGQIADINRNNNKLIEYFSISPADSALEAGKYSGRLDPLIIKIDGTLADIAALKTDFINGKEKDSGTVESRINHYQELLEAAISSSEEFSYTITKLYAANLDNIEYATKFTFYTFITVLLIATVLLVIFTISISDSFAIPVNSIIEQIRSLGAGKIDLTKKIDIRSKDEIGILSDDFNKLTEEIHDIVTFKKVIEEDHHIEDVYSRLGRAFIEKCGLDDFIIYEVSGSQQKMKPVYPVTLNNSEIYCNENILTSCGLCKVNTTGHTISSTTYTDVCKQFKPELGKFHLCIPMTIGGKTGGIVQFLFAENDYSFDNSKSRFKAEQYIKESLSVIEAKRLTNTLRESALIDPLTGLYNRRFLQEYTETLVAGVLRREKTVGLIMCDLDFFKQVNDKHGHNVGDMVLKETSLVIKKCVRQADLVIRFGGEEFLVLLLDINEGETIKVAEKIREAVGDTKVKITDGTIQKTISLGISEFPVDAESFWQTIKFADVALYKAKETGRNKAVRFTEEMWSENEF